MNEMNGEKQYLELIRNVLDTGVFRGDRTGVGTYSTFGNSMKFDLRKNTIPVFTTRKTFYRGAIEELLWMMRGDTNSKTLEEKKINIWKGNTTRQFLDSRGLYHLPEGDIGYLYSKVLRDWGNVDGTKGSGVDQLKRVIDLIRNEPTSRRILTSHYDVANLDKGCLEPCHTFQQFYVDVDKGELHNSMYMRSIDLMCGAGLNVIFYSLFNRLVSNVCGLKSGSFTLMTGDTHVYSNHKDNALLQIDREPFEFPTIDILKDVKTIEDIESLSFEDFKINDYKYHPPLKYEMAI